MGYDRKYGKVTLERKIIPDDEPLVVFRSQDELIVSLLLHYLDLCNVAKVQPYHITFVNETLTEVLCWRMHNQDKVKKPDTLPIENYLANRAGDKDEQASS